MDEVGIDVAVVGDEVGFDVDVDVVVGIDICLVVVSDETDDCCCLGSGDESG